MNKKKKYALNGALVFGIGNAVLNAINQNNEMDKDPTQKFDWERLLKAGAKGALIGGAGGLTIGAIKDYQNSKEKPVNTDKYLFSVIDEVRLNKTDFSFRALNQRADMLIMHLISKLGHKLEGYPTRLGSTENGTALTDSFDIDVCLRFKPSSYPTTEDMYMHLHDCLDRLVGQHGIIETREQKKSIGVVFRLNGVKRKIDVVPYKLTAKRGNKSSGYLYVNDSINPTYTKTDIDAIKSFRLTDTQKKLVIALKQWRNNYDLPLSSHLLQNFVVDAYYHNYVPEKFTKKVIMVLSHIRDNIYDINIRSIENTNNILTDISENAKDEIVRACKKTIEEYKYQPNSIIDNFSIDGEDD